MIVTIYIYIIRYISIKSAISTDLRCLTPVNTLLIHKKFIFAHFNLNNYNNSYKFTIFFLEVIEIIEQINDSLNTYLSAFSWIEITVDSFKINQKKTNRRWSYFFLIKFN
jgi:hypothetical protein